jgi:hypothetical protein
MKRPPELEYLALMSPAVADYLAEMSMSRPYRGPVVVESVEWARHPLRDDLVTVRSQVKIVIDSKDGTLFPTDRNDLLTVEIMRGMAEAIVSALYSHARFYQTGSR